MRGSTTDWREQEYAALREAAAATAGRWPDYAEYCRLRERGVRQRAFGALDRFLAAVAPADFAERRELALWLFEQDAAHDVDWEREPWRSTSMLCPHPLLDRLVDPTLDEWIEREPTDAQPRLMVGTVEALLAGHKLDPARDDIRDRLLRRYRRTCRFFVHELPAGYLGRDPREDLLFLVWARPIATGISDEALRTGHLSWMDRCIAVMKSYADYIADGGAAKQASFALWAHSRGRPASLNDC